VRKALDSLYLATGYLAGGFLVVVFLLMMVMSVGRQFGVNIPAGDDFTSWAMAAMAFLGLAHTFKSGELIRMGAVIDRLHGPPRRIAEITVLILGSLISGYLAWYAVWMTYESWLINDMSNGVIAVPLWIPQIAFGVGAIVLLIAMLDELVCVIAGHAPRYAKEPPKTREEILARASEGNL
jgi:TRAP-type C4-dicarboxylate transport system permease small subunit